MILSRIYVRLDHAISAENKQAQLQSEGKTWDTYMQDDPYESQASVQSNEALEGQHSQTPITWLARFKATDEHMLTNKRKVH